MKILFLFFVINTFTFTLYAQQKEWFITIVNITDSLEIRINNQTILHTKELGKIKPIWDDTHSKLKLWTNADTLFIGCTEFPANCPFLKPKKVLMQKRNILDAKFKLTFIGKDYKFSIKVNPKDGNYISFFDDYSVKKAFGWWYQQNDEPFEYGYRYYPPKRIK
ncbi:hypothetical protein [Thermoflexibacter ruber]|uniref:Uncharacterized protein n=1 Tax=Thermoflexibacter ruber TaxID=1003 RepID=A0A1I2JPU2_9BACT|nr:hypothetical protein [Thermoflexibacter ruber]SFF56128.1 hypothetical protein SAMN04488541_105811 [Thermoflexibacter ruber]